MAKLTISRSGFGFATCQRLLAQLSRPSPSDVLLGDNSAGAPQQQSPFAPTKQLTLVLACRNAKRANAARSLLLEFLDAEISRQKKSANYNGHAEEFRRGLNIDFLPLDLASMDSVFECAKEARRQYALLLPSSLNRVNHCYRYPYITHLILNAGVCEIIGFDWYVAIWQFLAGPVDAVTRPQYVIQPVGFESHDGLGLVWQSNVFGHYCLVSVEAN
jgi:3-keto steroid reductase